mgnify:CR=1 FL=1
MIIELSSYLILILLCIYLIIFKYKKVKKYNRILFFTPIFLMLSTVVYGGLRYTGSLESIHDLFLISYITISIVLVIVGNYISYLKGDRLNRKIIHTRIIHVLISIGYFILFILLILLIFKYLV